MADSLPLRINPEMITEIAMGLGAPVEIAKKYGLNELDFLQISGHPWFEKAVSARHQQLVDEGFTPRAKFANLAEDLMVHCYQQAKLSTSLSLALDVAKHLAKLGGLEPQPNQQNANAGAGFQLVINVPSTAGTTPQTLTINGSADPQLDIEDAISVTLPTALPTPSINSDLEEGVM